MRKLAPPWSINDVLQSLTKPPYEPLHRGPLDALIRKTVFLLAATSARRRSEVHALSVKKGFIRFGPSGVHLLPDPDFLSKNQSTTFTPNPIFLPYMSEGSSVREDRLVCSCQGFEMVLRQNQTSQVFRCPLCPRIGQPPEILFPNGLPVS